LRDFEDSVESGFQIAVFQGPLCAEPVVGMAYFIEEVTVDTEDGDAGKYLYLTLSHEMEWISICFRKHHQNQQVPLSQRSKTPAERVFLIGLLD